MSHPSPTDTFDFGENSAHNEAALEELTSAIAFGQGADTITLLLVRCNYAQLRDRMVAALLDKLQAEELQGQVHVLRLADQEHNLYAQIQAAMQGRRPGAVLVVGTETVTSLETLLVEMNKRREEFRRDFPFPIVLWFTDDGYRQLSHYANDFESIAGGETIEFRLSGAALSQQLRAAAQRMFEALLQRDVLTTFNRRLENLDLGCLRSEEVAIALADLQAQNYPLDPDLQASVAFARGLNVPNEEAVPLFEQSVDYWRTVTTAPQAVLKRGLALFYLGRAQYFVADQAKYREADWERALSPLEACLQVFDQAARLDLAAQGITQLLRTLGRLERWDELAVLAERSRELQQTYGNYNQLAQAYGHLGAVALRREQWSEAAKYAQRALNTIETFPNPSSWRILYLKIWAEAEYALGQLTAATNHLQAAQAMGVMEHPKLYSDVLTLLQQCLRDQRRYLEAFQVKRERLAIEKQYGLRAFIGAGRLRSQRIEQRATVQSERQTLEEIAPEIAASGRSQDLTELLRRLAGRDDKLLVLHGASGVGKSSLVNGGLLPALQARVLENRTNVPMLMRQYTDWERELAIQLPAALAASSPGQVGGRSVSPEAEAAFGETAPSSSSLLALLKECELANLRPILIFDQFEEFFFANPSPVARRDFFQFLADCLELPGALKIVLSLREDYLHFLLEGKQLVRRQEFPEGSMARSQLEDILGKRVLYEIGNFAPDDAKAIIRQLSSGSRMYLEPALIDALVDDLAGELQEVRPIEMQIVGAQLQTEGIQALSAYRELGDHPKETLVQRYLEDVVVDCGEENRQLAELVLFLLTDERGTRPLKTRPELVRDLEAFGISDLDDWDAGENSQESGANGQKLQKHRQLNHLTTQPSNPPATPLDLVLRILCGSGIGVQLPDTPDDRYQLVHDYLAGVIRDHQAPRLEALMAELEEEKRLRVAAESEKLLLTQANKKAKRRLFWSSGLLAASLVAALLAGAFATTATSQANRAEKRLTAREKSARAAETREKQALAALERAELEAQEVEGNLSTLENQARLSKAEIENSRVQFNQIQRQLISTQQKSENTQARLDQVTSEIQSIEAERTNLLQEQERLIKQERAIRQDLNSSQTELTSVQKELKASQFQLETIETELVESISEVLSSTKEQTQDQVSPAVLYISFVPKQSSQNIDEDYHLSLWLITHDKKTVRKSVPLATKNNLTRMLQEINGFSTDLEVFQKLYDWLIYPIDEDLQKSNINNIVFLMDESLRGIPLAALHNGEQFFVENYSFSVMPGLTLSDARYVPLKDAKLLMAGLSESPDFSLGSLPGVEVEISNLSVLWPDTKILLNEEFNYENLISIRRNEQHQVIHLATHGAYFPVQRDAEGEHRLAIGTDADRVPTLVLWDKVLVPQNISSQDWYTPPVDLLVLSTGGVGLGSADYEFGIAGSFLDAGVKSVMADIYLSDDFLYAQLMQEFYLNLRNAPIRAEALRRAQVSLINYLRDESHSRDNSKGIIRVPEGALLDRNIDEENIVLWGAGITIFGNPW